jgi:hypothetical protein
LQVVHFQIIKHQKIMQTMKNVVKTGAFALLLAFASCQKTDNPVAVVPKPVECKDTPQARALCMTCLTPSTCYTCSAVIYIDCFKEVVGTVKKIDTKKYDSYDFHEYCLDIEVATQVPDMTRKYSGNPTNLDFFLCKKGLLNASMLGKKIRVSGQAYECMAAPTVNIWMMALTSHFVISPESITILN